MELTGFNFPAHVASDFHAPFGELSPLSLSAVVGLYRAAGITRSVGVVLVEVGIVRGLELGHLHTEADRYGGAGGCAFRC